MLAESSLPPSDKSICRSTSAAAAWIYTLGLLQRIRGTASSPIHSEERDHRLKATSPERGDLWYPGRRSQADTQ